MITGNEPAHPYTDCETFAHDGLTIRQQFAMAAMQGLLSNNRLNLEWIAENSVKHADALIKELNKEL